MIFLHDVVTCAIGTMVFFIIFGNGEVSEKFPLRGLPFARLRLWPGASGGSHAAKSCAGGLSQVRKCYCGCKRPARVSGVCPPHERRCRRHLEGETDAWGLHGGDLAVGLARMLLQSVSYGLT